MSNWIKCSERMPPKLQKVLGFTMPFVSNDFTTTLDGKVLRSIDCVYVDQKGYWRDWAGPDRFGLQVTHWQPLPESPND